MGKVVFKIMFVVKTQYVKNFLFVSLVFIMHLVNYITIKNKGIHLYLGTFFDYNLDILNIITSFLISVPIITLLISRNTNNIFIMLTSLIIIVGVLPGSILYSLSSLESKYTFYTLYILAILILSIKSPKKINVISSADNNISQNTTMNPKFIKIFAFLGFLFYIYLDIKYFSILSFQGISDVYIQRSLFKSVVLGWEVYLIAYSKYISASCFLMLALYYKKFTYLIPLVYIYVSDYLLAAHKTSIALMLFSLIYYKYLYKMDVNKLYILLIITIVFIFTVALQFVNYINSDFMYTLVGLYDRIFFVTASLFARFYDFANNNYFFYGGSGVLGEILSSISVKDSYILVVGKEYFSDGVVANADLIADGYINFGFLGAMVPLFILSILFNRYDNYVYSKNFILLFPITFVYSLILFSMGLQTTLLTGGMFLYILIIKFGFNCREKL